MCMGEGSGLWSSAQRFRTTEGLLTLEHAYIYKVVTRRRNPRNVRRQTLQEKMGADGECS